MPGKKTSGSIPAHRVQWGLLHKTDVCYPGGFAVSWGSASGEAQLVHLTAEGRELLAAQEHCTDRGANAPRITLHQGSDRAGWCG